MCNVDLRKVSKEDPAYRPELERRSILVDGVERFFYLYIGKAYVTAIPVVFQFVPDGSAVEEFARAGGWLEAAEKDSFVVIFPEPLGGKWDLTGETDLVFWEKLRNFSDIRYKAHNTRQYIGGYLEGAAMAELAILRTPEFVGGMVLVNPPELGGPCLKNWGNQLSTEYVKYLPEFRGRFPIYATDVEQKVLIYHTKDNPLTETAAFWGQVGKGISPWAGIQVREMEDAKAFPEPAFLFEEFFNKTRRYRIAPNGELRPASDYRDNPNATRYCQEMAGTRREWIEVLPSGYCEEKKYPLVMALHGSNNDGPQFYDITRLWEVAEARGFICLFPTASRTDSLYDLWNFNGGTPLDNGNRDEEFLLELLAYYKKHYSVDTTRIYLTGFSNGGGMTQMMGMRYPHLFAAIMPYSGACKNLDIIPEVSEDTLYLPCWMNKGTLESYTSSLSVYGYGKQNWDHWVRRNHLAAAPDKIIKEERLETEIYEGAAECRFSLRINAHHAIFSEHYWSIYDDFFARFQRGADGSSIENDYSHFLTIQGRTVKLRHSKRIDGHLFVKRKELEDYWKELPSLYSQAGRVLDGEVYVEVAGLVDCDPVMYCLCPSVS